jgi:hypothetical protein
MRVKTVFAITASLSILLSVTACKKETAEKKAPALVIQSVTGDVTIKTGESEKKAVKGCVLNGNDVIITAKLSMTDILMGTEGVIRVNESSRLVISGIQADEQKINAALKLDSGKVFATVSKMKKDSSMTVKTPTTVAAVRGTSFRVSSSEKGSSIDVLSGKVQMNPVVNDQVIETVSTVLEKDKSATITVSQAKEIAESKKTITVTDIPVSVKEEIKTETAGITVAKNADVMIKDELSGLGIKSTEIESVQEIPAQANAVQESTPAAKEEPSVKPDTSKQDAEKELREKNRLEKAEKERLAKEQKDKAEKDRLDSERLAKEKAEKDRIAKEIAEKEKAAKEKEQKESRVKNIPNM